eukprot:Rmarinus@m.17095
MDYTKLIITCLVAVGIGLVGATDGNVDVLRLLLTELGEAGTKVRQVEASDLLVQNLGQDVHLPAGVLARLPLLPELDLGNNLVGEGAGHHEGRMTSGTAEVEEAALGKDNDAVAVSELIAVHLRLDLEVLDPRGRLEAGHVDLVVEVTDVANNGVVLHLGHVLGKDDTLVSGGGDKDIGGLEHILKANNLVTLHGSLERTNRVDLSDLYTGALGTHSLGTALADIAVPADDDVLPANHHIGGAHDAVREGVAAAVDVVELGLGNAVVDIDSGEQQSAVVRHLNEAVDTSSGLLRHTTETLSHLVESHRVLLDAVTDGLKHTLVLGVVCGVRVREGLVRSELLLELDTVVDEKSGIATVVDNLIGAFTIRPCEGLISTPPVLRESLALPGEDSSRLGLSDHSSSVVLRREDVARAPAHVRTKSLKSLNENSSLDSHVQRTHDANTLERLGRSELIATGHEPRHLDLSKVKLLAPKGSKAKVADLVVGRGFRKGRHLFSR